MSTVAIDAGGVSGPGRSKFIILQTAGSQNVSAIAGQIPADVEWAIEGIHPQQELPPKIYEYRSVVLLMPSEPNDWQGILNHVLKSHRTASVLAAVDRSNQRDLNRLLETPIHDIILLPAPEDEVKCKLNRLFQAATESQSGIDERRLFVQFRSDQFIGNSKIFLKAIEAIPRISSMDSPVMVYGETGTGKELCARAIHYLGRRNAKPFLPINCGAIPDQLFENELFGHEKGAYTNANESQGGIIRSADGGTIFLDEINTLSLQAQVKLLRFLEDRSYKPLGSSRYVEADLRILAASNEDLAGAVSAGRFREDLYYRINVLSVALPPLRQRMDDLPLLVAHFLRQHSRREDRGTMYVADGAMNALAAREWPGNIRELKNVIERTVMSCSGNIIREKDLRFDTEEAHRGRTQSLDAPFQVAKGLAIERFEREYLVGVLKDSDGNISKGAQKARMDRRSFQRLLGKHGIL
jgi:two-component system, NtrC family, response regulator GlrR